MMVVAITMLVTVLPSAATIPIASTNSGNAMMVSASRLTMRSVQPPKKPAAMPGSPPITNTNATELIGAEPVGQRRRLQAGDGVAGERIVRHDIGPDQRAQRDDNEQRERQ